MASRREDPSSGLVVCTWRGEEGAQDASSPLWARLRPGLARDTSRGEEELERRCVELRTELQRLLRARAQREDSLRGSPVQSHKAAAVDSWRDERTGGVVHSWAAPRPCNAGPPPLHGHGGDCGRACGGGGGGAAGTAAAAATGSKSTAADHALRQHWSGRGAELTREVAWLFERVEAEREEAARWAGRSGGGGGGRLCPLPVGDTGGGGADGAARQLRLEKDGWLFDDTHDVTFEVCGMLAAQRDGGVLGFADLSLDELLAGDGDGGLEAEAAAAARRDVAEAFSVAEERVLVERLLGDAAGFAVCFALQCREADAAALHEAAREVLRRAYLDGRNRAAAEGEAAAASAGVDGPVALRRTAWVFDRALGDHVHARFSPVVDAGASSVGDPMPLEPAAVTRARRADEARRNPPSSSSSTDPTSSYSSQSSSYSTFSTSATSLGEGGGGGGGGGRHFPSTRRTSSASGRSRRSGASVKSAVAPAPVSFAPAITHPPPSRAGSSRRQPSPPSPLERRKSAPEGSPAVSFKMPPPSPPSPPRTSSRSPLRASNSPQPWPPAPEQQGYGGVQGVSVKVPPGPGRPALSEVTPTTHTPSVGGGGGGGGGRQSPPISGSMKRPVSAGRLQSMQRFEGSGSPSQGRQPGSAVLSFPKVASPPRGVE